MIHAIIFLASGWLLMVPPVKEIQILNFGIDETRPWNEWDQRKAFDSARECELEREALVYKVFEIQEREAKEKEASTRQLESPLAVPNLQGLEFWVAIMERRNSNKESVARVNKALKAYLLTLSPEERQKQDELFNNMRSEFKRRAGLYAPSQARCLPSDVVYPLQQKK